MHTASYNYSYVHFAKCKMQVIDPVYNLKLVSIAS